jgi:hypothetical protein
MANVFFWTTKGDLDSEDRWSLRTAFFRVFFLAMPTWSKMAHRMVPLRIEHQQSAVCRSHEPLTMFGFSVQPTMSLAWGS